MNKKTRRKWILAVLLLLLMPFVPFIYRESQRKVELYVNPAFKISDYDSFDIEYEPGYEPGGVEICIENVLEPAGLKMSNSRNVTQKTLYIIVKVENGFMFPPHIGHFDPQFFYLKTDSVKMYNNKYKEQLLFKLCTWRGIFSNGYNNYYEYVDLIKAGLIQAGWKEKKDVAVPESKAP